MIFLLGFRMGGVTEGYILWAVATSAGAPILYGRFRLRSWDSPKDSGRRGDRNQPYTWMHRRSPSALVQLPRARQHRPASSAHRPIADVQGDCSAHALPGQRLAHMARAAGRSIGRQPGQLYARCARLRTRCSCRRQHVLAYWFQLSDWVCQGKIPVGGGKKCGRHKAILRTFF